MIKIFVNSWKTKEIRYKILYTLMIFAIIRLGTQIALPGIDAASVVAAREAAGVGTLYSMIAGGANSSWSIFAMGIGPYINASIIMQLLRIAVPKFEQLSKEGPEGRKKLQIFDKSIKRCFNSPTKDVYLRHFLTFGRQKVTLSAKIR